MVIFSSDNVCLYIRPFYLSHQSSSSSLHYLKGGPVPEGTGGATGTSNWPLRGGKDTVWYVVPYHIVYVSV